jgi:predicted dehydrogenase
MRATGEFGALEWDGIEKKVTLVLAGGDEQVFLSSQTHEEMLLTQDLAFVEASRGKHDTRIATGEDGVRALAICDAARQAAETRCEEKVNYI